MPAGSNLALSVAAAHLFGPTSASGTERTYQPRRSMSAHRVKQTQSAHAAASEFDVLNDFKRLLLKSKAQQC
jgi:hypothetical protein